MFGVTGRNEYRNGGSRDGHPSGLPRPYGGRGRGRGNSSNNERHDSGFDAPTWGSDTKDGNDGLGNFPGAKVQNSPGKEAFPGGWGAGGSGSGDSSWADGGGSGWAGRAGSNDNDGWGQESGGGVGGWGGAGANAAANAAADNEPSGWGSDTKKKGSTSGTSGWGSSGGGGW